MTPAYINSMASIHPGSGDASQGYLTASEPDYKELIKNPALRRRMSRIVKMGVACAMQCLSDTPVEEIDSIITATGLGCLADTERFMNNLLDNREQLLTPTPFIQSTFNTVGAQIAMLCGNQGYNMTYVHRGVSFESALLDAMLRLDEGDRKVLVGAFDEMTPTSHAIHQRLGAFRQNVGGEGAQFFLLGSEKTDKSLARITSPYGQRHIEEYLEEYGLSVRDIDFLIYDRSSITSDNGQDLFRNLYFPRTPYERFKRQCGEYQTAIAFGLWRAVQKLSEDKSIRHILVRNAYQWEKSFILVSRP
ncbi:3-oxoacyl-ACP synthase [Bacteroides sp. 51]|nr:3-oxoacyl-ACP synthase [Bacteroides sp. 51]